ncbi:MAG: CpsD/CapB family tyrosine-protein kinase [bacterium]|nr:MAG: CpsD/CapB family tyrosine-protein kinase [bacterium]
MSKIYDALRKAERDRGRLTKRRARRPPASYPRETERERILLRGMDRNFRRSLLNLRNSIDSEMRQKQSSLIMFTSAVKGEGKTIITASLGRILALGEKERILLVDCSIHNPELHTFFGAKNETGILDYLAGEAELPNVIQTLEEGFLDIVTAGASRDTNVTVPLFNTERMEIFARETAEQYDYVLIDTSAVLEAPETSIIGSYMDGVVMVVQAGKTRREVVKRAMMMIEKLEGKFIGTVLNRKKYHIPEFIYKRV